MPGDGTRQLLQWGSSMVGTGLVAVLLLLTLLGGFTRQGATPTPAGSCLSSRSCACPSEDCC